MMIIAASGRETFGRWYRGAHGSLHRKPGRYVPIVALTLSWVLFVHAKELLDEANRRQTRRDGPLVGAPITMRLAVRHSQSVSFITHSEGGRPLTRSALNSLRHIRHKSLSEQFADVRLERREVAAVSMEVSADDAAAGHR